MWLVKAGEICVVLERNEKPCWQHGTTGFQWGVRGFF